MQTTPSPQQSPSTPFYRSWRFPACLSLIVSILSGVAIVHQTALQVSASPPSFGPRFWWRFPLIHTGQIEEAFLGSMARHYGPDWLRWMPDAVIAEHWHRFPAAFGHGPEASFLQWMNHRFGLGWQAWVPTPQVHRSWQHFCGR